MKFAVIRTIKNQSGTGSRRPSFRNFWSTGMSSSSADHGVRFVLNLTGTDHPTRFPAALPGYIHFFTLVAAERPTPDLRTLCLHDADQDPFEYGRRLRPQTGPGDTRRRDLFHDARSRILSSALRPGGGLPADRPHRRGPLRHRQSTHRRPAGAFLGNVARCRTDQGIRARTGQAGRPSDAFSLRDLLSEESIREIYRLFEMRGLSYGNLSARERFRNSADDLLDDRPGGQQGRLGQGRP